MNEANFASKLKIVGTEPILEITYMNQAGGPYKKPWPLGAEKNMNHRDVHVTN